MTSSPQTGTLLDGLDDLLPALRDLYKDLHAHPELSFQETRTAGIVAAELRRQGWEVTEGVGGTGVVGVLRGAGQGPVVLLRADMDALPVREATGLPYASTATAVDRDGAEVPVMHACGHDVHVTCLVGATALLAAHRGAWGGTVVAVFQPAEEVGGAPRMFEDGFAERFPVPAVCLGQHVAPGPTGLVATRPGPLMSAADNLRVRIHGRGGHGSMPELTVDPVVIAASAIMRLQTIVSREVPAGKPAVVTVGSVHAGTKENIVPDSAELGITVRTTSEQVRWTVLAAIERIVRAEAQAGGAEKEPEFVPLDTLPLLVNDADATERVQAAHRALLGDGGVLTLPAPLTGSEDFGTFGTALGVPSVFWHFGGIDPALFTEADLVSLLESGLPRTIPANHSPLFAPAVDPTLEIGVKLLVAAAAAWLGGSGDSGA